MVRGFGVLAILACGVLLGAIAQAITQREWTMGEMVGVAVLATAASIFSAIFLIMDKGEGER